MIVDDQMILPEQGTATDSDTFTLTFNEAIQGKAVVSVGGIGENAGANYIHTQDGSSTNWRVTHSLSQQYPNVTVYDDTNQVIIPESIITAFGASSNEMDITFSSGKTVCYANFSIGSGIPNISAENAGKVLKVRYGYNKKRDGDKVWNGHQHQMMYQAQCLFLVVSHQR